MANVQCYQTVQFDCNISNTNVGYWNCSTTDFYRKGNPYKQLRSPGRSHIIFDFYYPPLEKGDILASSKFRINHCGTTANGIVDISVNGTLLLFGHSAPRNDFAFEDIDIPIHLLQEGINELMIRLNKGSWGVYWYSDAVLSLNTCKFKSYAQT